MIDKNRWELKKKNREETFYYWKKTAGNENKMKEKKLLGKLCTPMILYRCSLLTQHDKWLVKTVEKLFKLHVVDGIYPSKRSILKNYSMFYSEIENNVLLQSWNVSASHGIVMHSQSQRFLFNKEVQKVKIVFKSVPHLCHSCYTQTPWVMFSVIISWIYNLRFP